MITYLPYKFKQRPYQMDAFNAFFKKRYKRFVTIAHRRAGKDKTWLNIMIAAMEQRVGTYLYVFPTLTQGEDVIWSGMDKEGMPFLDHFPPNLIESINHTRCRIIFKNGSIFQLRGGDNYNARVGANPIGIVFSEYSLTNPLAWDFFRPILRENGGWASFIYTPRGENHGYKQYQTATADPQTWFTQLLTVDDTKDWEKNRIVTPEMIEQERREGMSEEMIQQEYYCSFTTPLVGAYFAKQMTQAQEQGRIIDFPIDTSFPVSTYWDLGVGDNCCIWLIQHFRNEYRAIAYYENCGEGLQHYINWLHDFRNKYGFIYQTHYAPHDIAKRELSTGKSLIEIARGLGIHFMVVERVRDKLDAIESARQVIPKVYFHKTNCAHGIKCLREYRKQWNENLKTYMDQPLHDWASHGADAFMTFAQSRPAITSEGGTIFNRVNQSAI